MARPVTPIGFRIALGYAVLLALLAFMGVLGIRLINLTAESTFKLHSHPFTVTNAVSEVRRRILAVNERLVEAFAFPDREHANEFVSELPRETHIVDENIAVAANSYLGPVSDLETLRASWEDVRRESQALAVLIEQGQMAEARRRYHSGGELAFERALANTSDMVVFASAKANEFVAESARRRDEWVRLVTAAMAGGLLAGTVLATALTRHLSRSLGALRQTMVALAHGELDVHVPGAGRSDEIGEMARALEVFKQAAADKLQTELKFATVFDACPDIIAITDRKTGVFLDVNEAFERMIGYRRDEAVGRSSQELATWASYEDRTRMIEALSQSPRLANFETSFRRKDGEAFVVLLSVAPARLRDRDCLIIVARDISERKRAEEMLLLSTQELERSNIELERFAYVAAHDLQEPCRTICSFSQLLERRHGDRLDASGRELLGFLADGARRMRALVNGLLEYSRAGQSATPFADVDLTQVVEAVRTDLAAAVDSSGARVTVAPLPKIRGDAAQLHQLFTNLLGNAIKFQAPGKVPEITVSAVAGDGDWLVTVRDNGIGIPAEHAEEVFAVFRRLHGPTTYPGAGIGLAVSKRIVERHGGRIWINSEPGWGTAMQFTLPAA